MGLKVLTKEAIEQSMEDGFFQGYRTQPKESEIEGCIEFFEAKGTDEIVINLLNMVVDRDVLISGFDMDKKEPKFILNEIVKQ